MALLIPFDLTVEVESKIAPEAAWFGVDREKGKNRTLSIHPGSSEVPEYHGHSSNLVDTSVALYMIASERETSGLQRQ